MGKKLNTLCGAEEAREAHNLEVGGSKPLTAIYPRGAMVSVSVF